MPPEASNVAASAAASPAAAPQSAFVTKAASYPIVHSAIDLAKFYYDTTKTRFEIVGQVEKEITERVPQVLSATAKVTPQSAQVIVSKGLSQLDSYATTGLEIFEKNVPIINKPTPEVINSVIQPVNLFVGKALDFSEQKVDAFLPGTDAQPSEGQAEEEKPRLDNITRAQKLAIAISQRLTKRTLHQFELVSANVQLLSKHLTKEEFNLLVKQLEAQIVELRAHLTAAIASLEKVTPATLRDNGQAIFASLSKSVLDFADQTKTTLASLSLSSSAVNDPYLKKFLETLSSSIAQLQLFGQTLSHTNIFSAFHSAPKVAAPAPEVAPAAEVVPEAPEEKGL